MPGTSIYSVLFYAGTVIIAVFGVYYLIGVWRNFAEGFQKASKEIKPAPSWVSPTIKTILTVTVLIVALNIGWNVKQSVTTSSSKYENPSEKAEKKALQEYRLPSRQEMDSVRIEQKDRAEVKPYEDAIKSFDESMKEEAEKIKKRSLAE